MQNLRQNRQSVLIKEITCMTQILFLQGPNLNLLGLREPEIYGKISLDELHHQLKAKGLKNGLVLDFYQTNVEGEMISRIHQAFFNKTPFIIINPGAFTHSSIAIRDAFLATQIPFIEVHISNTYSRETFRQRSYLSDIAKGVIIGLGLEGYHLALDYACNFLSRNAKNKI